MAFYLTGMSDELPQIEIKKIDWGYLYLETKKSDATTDIFKTRRQAVRILTETKEKLFNVLYASSVPSLKDVHNDAPNEMLRFLIDAGFLEIILET